MKQIRKQMTKYYHFVKKDRTCKKKLGYVEMTIYDCKGRTVKESHVSDGGRNKFRTVYVYEGSILKETRSYRDISELSAIVHYFYNSLGDMVRERAQNAKGSVTHEAYCRYDRNRRRIEAYHRSYDGKNVERWMYDDKGQMIEHINDILGSNLQKLVSYKDSYEYDDNGRLIEFCWHETRGRRKLSYKSHFLYNTKGLRIEERNNGWRRLFQYDDKNHLMRDEWIGLCPPSTCHDTRSCGRYKGGMYKEGSVGHCVTLNNYDENGNCLEQKDYCNQVLVGVNYYRFNENSNQTYEYRTMYRSSCLGVEKIPIDLYITSYEYY